LCLCDGGADAEVPEEIVKELGHLVNIETSVPVGIVLVKHRLDVRLEHLVLK